MIQYFARHPTAANLLMAALMILGLVTLPKLQRDTFPIIPPTEVEVRIPYPGARPADVESDICQRCEDALDTVSGLQEVRCDARENLAILTAQMYEGGDMDAFYNDVKSQIESITTFPEKVERPSTEIVERVAEVAGVMITGDMSPEDLKTYAEKVMIVRPGQVTPMHFHFNKTEDIINRGGGRLVCRLYNATSDERLDQAASVTVSTDGVVRSLAAGDQLVLAPGESVTLPPRLYHSFWGQPECGTVLVGEVSKVNDDRTDNRFLEKVGRFPEIDEDEPAKYLLCNEYPPAT